MIDTTMILRLSKYYYLITIITFIIFYYHKTFVMTLLYKYFIFL